MSTISENHLKDIEKAEEEVVIKIERSRVSFGDKLWKCLSKWIRLYNGWALICVYAIIMAIGSLSLVVYLKATGEWTPFCLYDNWYYVSYYLFLCFFAAILIPTADFDLYPVSSQFWQWTRRLGSYSWLLELEGFAYLLIFFKDIAYEVEFDDEAQIVVWALATLGVFRFITVSVGYWSAVDCLKRIERRNKLGVNHFGNTYTDLCDILAVQLIAQSLYYYQFNIYNIGFLLSASYLYIAYFR